MLCHTDADYTMHFWAVSHCPTHVCRYSRRAVPPAIAIPNGELGSWNGGLLMGAGPPFVLDDTA